MFFAASKLSVIWNTNQASANASDPTFKPYDVAWANFPSTTGNGENWKQKNVAIRNKQSDIKLK